MKTLLLMRHAKSSWDDAGAPDHDRPLNARGKRDAPRMGAFLKRQNIAPDLILSSTAKRARKTAAAVQKATGCEAGIVLAPGLYLASPQHMRQIIRTLPDDVETVMLVGHNPGTEELLEALTGDAQAMPTACVAQIALPEINHWREIGAGVQGEIAGIWRPKEVFD